MSDGPDFLVIGAQKSGTTTLYEDLRSHPDIQMPEKESSLLLQPGMDSDDGRRRYLAYFSDQTSRHVTGEVSTEYAMLPRIDAAAVAKRTIKAVKIIYIVRDPVQRIISQHHHHVTAKRMGPDIDQAVLRYPTLTANSRYATQIAPWIAAFGRDSVHVICFEDYMRNRDVGVAEVQRFLGVSTRRLPSPDTAYNTSEGKRVVTGLSRRLWASPLYQKLLRPVMLPSLRQGVAHLLLAAPPERPAGPMAATTEYLVNELAPEVTALGGLLGEPPWWDLRDLYNVPVLGGSAVTSPACLVDQRQTATSICQSPPGAARRGSP